MRGYLTGAVEPAAKETCEYRLLHARSVLGGSPPVHLTDGRPERLQQLEAGLYHAGTMCWRLTGLVNGISTFFFFWLEMLIGVMTMDTETLNRLYSTAVCMPL